MQTAIQGLQYMGGSTGARLLTLEHCFRGLGTTGAAVQGLHWQYTGCGTGAAVHGLQYTGCSTGAAVQVLQYRCCSTGAAVQVLQYRCCSTGAAVQGPDYSPLSIASEACMRTLRCGQRLVSAYRISSRSLEVTTGMDSSVPGGGGFRRRRGGRGWVRNVLWTSSKGCC
jgi:hypothetical protein